MVNIQDECTAFQKDPVRVEHGVRLVLTYLCKTMPCTFLISWKGTIYHASVSHNQLIRRNLWLMPEPVSDSERPHELRCHHTGCLQRQSVLAKHCKEEVISIVIPEVTSHYLPTIL